LKRLQEKNLWKKLCKNKKDSFQQVTQKYHEFGFGLLFWLLILYLELLGSRHLHWGCIIVALSFGVWLCLYVAATQLGFAQEHPWFGDCA